MLLITYFSFIFIIINVDIYTELDLDGKFANPEMELMILAILLIRPEMAKLFWKHGSVRN